MVSSSNHITDARSEHVRIVRADERHHIHVGWFDSYQSFVASDDADDTRFGLLVVHNESVIAPNSGFPLHAHQDMEIVTWIFDGEMEHVDSEGRKTTIYPGLAQRMSAGTGLWHSEVNPSADVPSHGVQMWVLPDTETAPSYAQADVAPALASGSLVPVISGSNRDAAITLNQSKATLWAANLDAGGSTKLPEAAFNHLFIGTGSVELAGIGRLSAGDTARISNSESRTLIASSPGTQILLWQMDR